MKSSAMPFSGACSPFSCYSNRDDGLYSRRETLVCSNTLVNVSIRPCITTVTPDRSREKRVMKRDDGLYSKYREATQTRSDKPK